MPSLTVKSAAALCATVAAACAGNAHAGSSYGASVIHSFGTTTGSGSAPSGGGLTLGRDGNFYGATGMGGAHGSGTLFRMTQAGAVTTLYSFSALSGITNADGEYPMSGLVQGADGSFYGVASDGGSHGTGTVFKWSPQGTLTVLHTFGPFQSNKLINSDGAHPNPALLLDSDGSLVGTTQMGGSYNNGTLYRLGTDGSFSVIYNFGGPASIGIQPSVPLSGVIKGNDGNYYGTTNQGGPSGYNGGIYRLTPAGQLKVLHWFNGRQQDGYDAEAPLVLGDDGNFYGATAESLVSGVPTDKPLLFRITPTGTFTVLHLGNDQGPYGNGTVDIDGVTIDGGLTKGSDGNFYGATALGGEFGKGSLFRMAPDGTFTTLYYFGGVSGDAASAGSGATFGPDGNLYGVSNGGGSKGKGAAFRLPLPAPTGWDSGPAIVMTATVSPGTIPLGQSATVGWSSTNAARCELFSGSPGVAGQSVALNGSVTVTPTSTGTYRYSIACDKNGRVTVQQTGLLKVTRN